MNAADDVVDPATLGPGPFLLVSEGVLGGRRRVVVDVLRGRLDLQRLRGELDRRWGRPSGRALDVELRWYRDRSALFWSAYGPGLWSIVLAPTTPRVAALAAELDALGAVTGRGVAGIAGWTDEQAGRLSTLLGLARERLAADLSEPPWLMTFAGASDAEAFLIELEYELDVRSLPPGEPSFGPGPWLVTGAGYQGDVVEVDVLWGAAHRYSIAGVIRRGWGSGDGVLELRGRWWDEESDGDISLMPHGDPFDVRLRRVSPDVARASAELAAQGLIDGRAALVADWPDSDARRFRTVLRALSWPVRSRLTETLFHVWALVPPPERICAVLEELAEPPARALDPASADDVAAVRAAVDGLADGDEVAELQLTPSLAVVTLPVADDAPGRAGTVRAGPIRLLWYTRRRGIPFRPPTVDPAELARFVAGAADAHGPVELVELSGAGDGGVTLSVTSSGREQGVRWGRIDPPSPAVRDGWG